jgi:TonB family protein
MPLADINKTPWPHPEDWHPAKPSETSTAPGSVATRDEYLASLVTLTRQHTNLLPPSLIGDRRGETVISVKVSKDGAIGPIGVLRSSGYPDIDERIEQMVSAVGRYPPLPQWYSGDSVQLPLFLRFPDALQH